MKFIMNEKVDFISDLLNRVNKNLKKRNLEPIFTVKKTDNGDNIFKKKKEQQENERYMNVKANTVEQNN